MAGRKPLHENELERRIRESCWLKAIGYCNHAIAKELCLSPTSVSIYLQGYSSQKKYKEVLRKKTEEYERKLYELKEKIPVIGYKITELKKTTRGLVISLQSINFIASGIETDLKENIDKILTECSLEKSKFRFSSRQNKISIACYGIDARAFLEAYAAIILKREYQNNKFNQR